MGCSAARDGLTLFPVENHAEIGPVVAPVDWSPPR